MTNEIFVFSLIMNSWILTHLAYPIHCSYCSFWNAYHHIFGLWKSLQISSRVVLTLFQWSLIACLFSVVRRCSKFTLLISCCRSGIRCSEKPWFVLVVNHIWRPQFGWLESLLLTLDWSLFCFFQLNFRISGILPKFLDLIFVSLLWLTTWFLIRLTLSLIFILFSFSLYI